MTPSPISISLTRGHGLLESFLARMRARQANGLIPSTLRQGCILDIGCGTFPYFLSHTHFVGKFAVDQLTPQQPTKDIQWYTVDLNHTQFLPFEGEYFSAVTMLAVVEHLNPDGLTTLFKEIHRILKPGGRLVITTPASWSDGLLHWMARIGLVSEDEINEHVYAYTLPLLGWYFGQAGFGMSKVKFGYFEFFLNMWAIAEK